MARYTSTGDVVPENQTNYPPPSYLAPFNGIATNRKVTDKIALIFMAIYMTVLLALLAYCMANGDINRVTKGYDDCGNVCGRPNPKSSDEQTCYGQDMTNKKYLLTRFLGTKFSKECVEDCKKAGGYVDYLNRCTANEFHRSNESIDGFLIAVAEDMQICWIQLMYLSFIALVFSLMVLVLLRYATAFIVWASLILFLLIFIVFIIYFWILYGQSVNQARTPAQKDTSYGYLVAAITFSIIGLILAIVFAVLIRKINFVIQIFKEGTKSIAGVPFVLLQPISTGISLILTITFWVYFTMWIRSAGHRTITPQNTVVYEQDTTMKFTVFYNLLAYFWIIQFIFGCQHLIVSGSIATWFFARDKTNLGSPYLTSSVNLIKYHLGTVAFGSLIIAIIQFIRVMANSLRHSGRNNQNVIVAIIGCCLKCCLDCLENFFKFFSRNAYIMTAIHGLPFWSAGKRALELIVDNIYKVAAINSLGDYVLFILKILVTAIMTVLGYEILKEKAVHYLWFVVLFVALFSFIIAHCVLSIFEMAIDTLLLCFCEDCEVNDGLSKPYFMSKDLMKFVHKYGKKE